MLQDTVGAQPPGAADDDTVFIETVADTTNVAPGAEPAAEAQFVREQLARDIADIERATAALRQAEPGLESWTGQPVAAPARKSGPVWLLIGLLWLSTALAVGTVVVIATFVG